MSDNKVWRSPVLAQVLHLQSTCKVKQGKSQVQKNVNCCYPVLALLGLTAELPPQAARCKLLVELEFYILAFGEIFLQNKPCSPPWLCRPNYTMKSLLNVCITYHRHVCTYALSMVNTETSVSKFPLNLTNNL